MNRTHRKLAALLSYPLAWTVGIGLLAGIVLYFAGNSQSARGVWALTTAIALAPLVLETARALRRGRVGVDLIALLAMAGALALGEYLAGAVIALMLSGGQALEGFAAGRAKRELTALLERAPRSAWRETEHGWEEVPAEQVAVDDLLLVKPGELVPVDGELREAAALDESTFTGEAPLVDRAPGEAVRSGVLNGGGAFRFRATSTAATSAYAGIVRLVEQAQTLRPRFARLADRWAGFFVPLTLAVAGLAWWLGDDSRRALAVLVVATPCPLILAAPVAFVGGLSRSAKRGILVKGGQALETLAHATTLILDKTGTVTTGEPILTETLSRDPATPSDDILRLAAALDQVSPHVYATPIVRAARADGRVLAQPLNTVETPGRGIRGRVEGRDVALGKLEYLNATDDPWAAGVLRRARQRGSAIVFVALDGALAGALVLEDPTRGDARETIAAMRDLGISRVVLLTGDHRAVGDAVGAEIGVDSVLAERTPLEKVETVRAEAAHAKVVMVGDGLNDAAALAVADVGVALGVRGSAASVESADIVITVDRFDRLAEARRIAIRTESIAHQSVAFGMGLSLVAMLVAGLGYLPPAAGALVQEVIDVAVILNALRTLRG